MSKELKKTKPGTKDTKTVKKKRKPGSGGARVGAGRLTDSPKPYTMRVSQEEKDMIETHRNKKQT